MQLVQKKQFPSKNNRNTKFKICSKLIIKMLGWPHYIILVFLFLTLNIFHTFFYCFYCWLWTRKCQLGLLKNKKDAELALPGNSIFKNVEIRIVKGLHMSWRNWKGVILFMFYRYNCTFKISIGTAKYPQTYRQIPFLILL